MTTENRTAEAFLLVLIVKALTSSANVGTLEDFQTFLSVNWEAGKCGKIWSLPAGIPPIFPGNRILCYFPTTTFRKSADPRKWERTPNNFSNFM